MQLKHSPEAGTSPQVQPEKNTTHHTSEKTAKLIRQAIKQIIESDFSMHHSVLPSSLPTLNKQMLGYIVQHLPSAQSKLDGFIKQLREYTSKKKDTKLFEELEASYIRLQGWLVTFADETNITTWNNILANQEKVSEAKKIVNATGNAQMALYNLEAIIEQGEQVKPDLYHELLEALVKFTKNFIENLEKMDKIMVKKEHKS